MRDRASGDAAEARGADDGALRILQVFSPGSFGGAESVVTALAVGLARRGHELVAAATIDADGTEPGVLARLREEGVASPVVRVPARRYDVERRELVRIGRDFRPHVVHTHGYRSDLVGSSAARAIGAPVVTTVHGYTRGDWKNRLYEHLQRLALRRFDAVVAVSDALAEDLRARRGELRLVTIRNGWIAPGRPLARDEARGRLGLSGDDPVVGWVGRLTPEKGCDLFLEAATRLDGPEARFSILGDGPERDALRARFRDLERRGRVRWHGAQPDAWALLRAFDLLVLSSRTEGTPIVLLEAAHAGVPVVATSVGGVPDVLGEEGGWLVSPGRPDALAGTVARALADPEEGRRRARRLAERVRRRFDAGRWVEAHERLYRRVRAASR